MRWVGKVGHKEKDPAWDVPAKGLAVPWGQNSLWQNETRVPSPFHVCNNVVNKNLFFSRLMDITDYVFCFVL